MAREIRVYRLVLMAFYVTLRVTGRKKKEKNQLQKKFKGEPENERQGEKVHDIKASLYQECGY